MRAQFLKVTDDIRASYWFIPALMAFASIALAFALVWLDASIGTGWLDGASWFYAARPEGARQVLATIAGSMITVAGVVFSLTIAAVSYTAGQYGPRLLTNFMRDRGNQLTLGTFIGTFLYCIIVLRTVRSAEEAAADLTPAAVGSFVPNIALFAGMALAIASIAVLIYFIHHVAQSISINNVTATIGRQVVAAIEARFPAFIGEPAGDAAMPPRRRETADIHPDEAGYIEAIDDVALVELACRHDLTIRLTAQPGDFVHPGRSIMVAQGDGPLAQDAAASLRRTFALGGTRTPLQDLRFLVNELAEIIARALSPGVNDPFTAIACLDWLTAAAVEIGNRDTPDQFRRDAAGAVRVIARPFAFADFVELSFGRVRPYVAADPNAALHALDCLASAGLAVSEPFRRAALRTEADELATLADAVLAAPLRAAVAARAAGVAARLT